MVRIEGQGPTYGNYAPKEPGPIKHSQSPFSSRNTPKEQFINIANNLRTVDPLAFDQRTNLETQLKELIPQLDQKDKQNAISILNKFLNIHNLDKLLSKATDPNVIAQLEAQLQKTNLALETDLSNFEKP